MSNPDIIELLVRAIYAVATLYMMMLLLRWLGPWVELDLHSRRLAWIPMATDPLIKGIRGMLPQLGPMDFAPLAAVLAVWVARTLMVAFLMALIGSGD